MFTGIIQEVGIVKRLEKTGSLYVFEVGSAAIPKEVIVGDSVAVNGVCLTVTDKTIGSLRFDVMAETVRKSGLGKVSAGDAVNLEGSLKAGGTIGGHFVLGHVDCVGTITDTGKKGDDVLMKISFSARFAPLAVEKGSIAVDGVSLTIGMAGADSLTVYLIPHTLKATTLGSKRRADTVNLEFDIIGKYIARAAALKGGGRITEGFLRSRGF